MHPHARASATPHPHTPAYRISTVAVTGATGFLGREVVRELLARGYRLRALIRDQSKAAHTLPAHASLTLIEGDVLDQTACETLVAGCDAVVHLVGIIQEVRERGRAQTFQGMHVTSVRRMVDAAIARGVPRFVHVSAINATPDAKAEYLTTKWEGERIVRRSSLDWTVFRPGIIHGPDGELIQQMRKIATGDSAPWLVMPYFARFVDHEEGVLMPRKSLEAAKMAPIAVEDVALAIAESLARQQTIGEVYNLVGPEVLDWRQFSEFLRDTLPNADKRLPAIPVPGEHAAIIAKVARHLGIAGLLPFSESQALMATGDTDADTHKARTHLGLEPRPFRATVRGYAHTLPALT